jgi:hypothetical protein
MENNKFLAKVNVVCEQNDRGGLDISIGHTENIELENATMILASAISLAVKTINQKDGMRDYELMEQVIKYLNHEFTSTESFSDAKLIYKKNEK